MQPHLLTKAVEPLGLSLPNQLRHLYCMISVAACKVDVFWMLDVKSGCWIFHTIYRPPS